MQSIWYAVPALMLGLGSPPVDSLPATPVSPIVSTPGVLVDVNRGVVIVNGQVIRWNPATTIHAQPAEQPLEPQPPVDVPAPAEPQPADVVPEVAPEVAPVAPAPEIAPVAPQRGGVVIQNAANGVGKTLIIDNTRSNSRTVISNSRQGFGNTIIVDDGDAPIVLGGKVYQADRHPTWTKKMVDPRLNAWLYWSAKDTSWFRYDAANKCYRQHALLPVDDDDEDD